MNPKILFWIFILGGVGLEIVADVYFKKWAVETRNLFFWLGLGIYTIGTVLWAFSLRYQTMSKTIAIFAILNLLIIASIGVIFFGETLSILNKIGIALGIISIVFVTL